MGYKQSKYNFFFDAEDGTHLAFNAMSGGFAKIKDEDYEEIEKLLYEYSKNNNYTPISERQDRLCQSLIKGQFIIEDDTDEIALLKLRNRKTRFKDSVFTLTIAPTLNCNFRCRYCYIDPKSGIMSEEVASNLVKLVGKKTKHIKRFVTSWTGGEPLLCQDIMSRLSIEFKKIGRENGCEYRSTLVTNGYLLSKEVVSHLDDMNVNFIQVTIDGPPEIHNKRRPLKNGGGTFGTIINNLQNLVNSSNVAVGIRVNVDNLNKENIEELFSILERKNLKEKACIGISRVTSSETCADYGVNCFRADKFAQYEIEIARKLLKKGFQIIRVYRPIPNVCQANELEGYIVAPDGKLYKCWEENGIDGLSVGYIGEDGELHLNYPKLSRWLAQEPFDIEECKNCKFLPLCMGGCIKERKVMGQACPPWKYNFFQMLQLSYEISESSENKRFIWWRED